jgi:thiol-disulfide isomerase/thioredoxin
MDAVSRWQRLAAACVAVGLALASNVAPAAGDVAGGGAEATDQHGRRHVWKGPSGQLTILEFAASWCAPCRRTLPRLEAFATRHPEVRVLSVSVDERREGRDELVKALGLRLPMLWDEGHRIAAHYQPAAMPSAFLLSPEGELLLVALGSGERDWQELERRVERELAPP